MPPSHISVTLALRGAARFAAEVRAARKELIKLRRATQGGGAGLRLFGIGLRVAGLGAIWASQGVAALTLATVGLVSALGPVLGLVGALPAGLALVAQAFAVWKLATLGVTDALGPLSGAIDPDKFAALSRPAQDLVLALDAMKGSVRSLQRDLQGGLFPGVLAGLIAARPALAALRGPLIDTARGTGAWVASLGRLVGSKGFLSDLRTQAQFNNVQLGRLGVAALHLVNVFRNLMVGSRGLVSWIVRGVAAFAKWADHTTKAARASGGLQRGFHTVQVTTSRIVRILWRFGKAILNIGRVGKREIGDGILVWLVEGATALERWTRSEAGIRKMTAAFTWAKGVLASIGIWMQRISTEAGPGLSELFRNIIGIMNRLAQSDGGVVALKLYVGAINQLAGALNWALEKVPGLKFAISALLAVMILNKVTGFGTAIWTLGRAIAGTTLVARLAYPAFWALNGALVGLRAAAAAAWVAVTGPVGLVVLGVAAVVAAVLVLYNKWGWFHRAVDNTWDFIQSHWHLLGTILLAPFLPVVKVIEAIVSGIGKVKGLAGGIGGKAKSVYDAITPWAAGGVVNSPLQLVGERGPEIAAMPMGTRVFSAPETRTMLRAPTMPRVSGGGGGSAGGSSGPTIVRNYITLQVDRHVLARTVNDVVADERAGG